MYLTGGFSCIMCCQEVVFGPLYIMMLTNEYKNTANELDVVKQV